MTEQTEQINSFALPFVVKQRTFEAQAVDVHRPFPIDLRVVDRSSDSDVGWSITLAEAAQLHVELGEAIEKVQLSA